MHSVGEDVVDFARLFVRFCLGVVLIVHLCGLLYVISISVGQYVEQCSGGTMVAEAVYLVEAILALPAAMLLLHDQT